MSSRIVVPELPQSSGPAGARERAAVDDQPAASRRPPRSRRRARAGTRASTAGRRRRGSRRSRSGPARARRRARRGARPTCPAAATTVPARAAAGWTVTVMGGGRRRARSRAAGRSTARSSQSRLRASASVACGAVAEAVAREQAAVAERARERERLEHAIAGREPRRGEDGGGRARDGAVGPDVRGADEVGAPGLDVDEHVRPLERAEIAGDDGDGLVPPDCVEVVSAAERVARRRPASHTSRPSVASSTCRTPAPSRRSASISAVTRFSATRRAA